MLIQSANPGVFRPVMSHPSLLKKSAIGGSASRIVAIMLLLEYFSRHSQQVTVWHFQNISEEWKCTINGERYLS